MRRIQHIGFVLLLGLWVLAGCQRENPGGAQESQDAPEQIVFGPARASLYLSVRGFGDSYTLTKADYVDVDQTLHYDYEKNLKDLRVLIFDASQVSEAYRTESGKYVFDPSGAKYVACAEPEFMEADGENVRVDFTLDKPYASLALIGHGCRHLPAHSPGGRFCHGPEDVCRRWSSYARMETVRLLGGPLFPGLFRTN